LQDLTSRLAQKALDKVESAAVKAGIFVRSTLGVPCQ
jgi:hypothetical protein